MNKRGFFSLQMITYSVIFTLILMSLILYFRSQMDVSKQQFKQLETVTNLRNALERSYAILEQNIDYEKTLQANDLDTEVSVTEMNVVYEPIALQVVQNQTDYREYTFKLYSRDDIAFTFENMPLNTTITVQNSKGFMKQFTDSNVFIDKNEIYNLTDPYNVNLYGDFTLKLETLNTTDDLSSLIVHTFPYKKEKTIQILAKNKTSLDKFTKEIKVQNNQDGNNVIFK